MTDGGVPRWALISGVTLLALCFGVAYHWGTVSQRRSVEVPLATMRHSIELLTADAAACDVKLDKIFKTSLRGKPSQAYERLHRANETHAQLVRQERDATANMTACQAALMKQRADLAEQRRGGLMRTMRILTLTQTLERVNGAISRVRDGLGMQRVLLLDAIKTERMQRSKLLRKLGEPVPAVPAADDARLIAEFASNESLAGNVTIEDVGKEIAAERAADTSYAELKVSKFIKTWRTFHYDPAEHPDVFMPSDDGPLKNGSVARPVYFNRTAPTDPVLGVSLERMSAPVRTTSYQIKSVTTVALCAYRHRNANMTFPAKFRRVSNVSEVAWLNETIDTPLVTLCRYCTSSVRSTAFTIACARDRPRRLYGSYDFWAARSMVRPTQAVIDAARAKYNQLGLAGRRVLGAAFKSTPQLRRRCRAATVAPLWHYMWARAITASTNGTLFEAVSHSNRTEQCRPTKATLFEALEALRQRFKFDAIVVSVETAEEEEFIRGSDFGGAAQVAVIRPTTAFEDMVDVTLMSWADHILVNRHSDYSQVLTEAFALRNGIKAERVHFF